MRLILFQASLSVALLLASAMAFAAPKGEKVIVPGGSYTNLSPTELHSMLKSKDFFMANVHIPYEGELPQTDAFLQFDKTQAELDAYPADKKAKVVLYCRSGRMSDIAARDLVKAGYTNVYNLSGGMIAWEEAGYEMKRDSTRP